MLTTALAGLSMALIAGPALAQKSKDTLRVAQNEAFKAISNYYFPTREASFIYRQVYAPMINFDEWPANSSPNWRRRGNGSTRPLWKSSCARV